MDVNPTVHFNKTHHVNRIVCQGVIKKSAARLQICLKMALCLYWKSFCVV